MGPTYGFGFWSVPGLAPYLLVVWGAFCLFLAVRQRLTGLALATIAAGIVQWPMIAFVGNLVLQLSTDIAALSLLAAVAWRCRAVLLRPPVLMGMGALGVFLLAQAFRSDDPVGAVLALRQLLYPMLLLGAGWLAAPLFDWRRLGRVVSALTLAVATYMIAEKLYGGPILDPTPSEVALAGGRTDGLRLGLPFAYISDGIGATPYVRPGGPFFNPPIAGAFLGVGAYAAVRWLRPRYAVIVVLASTVACSLAVARAGLLLLAVVLLVPMAFRLLGRWTAVMCGVVAAALAAGGLAQQGATASHGQGLVEGIQFALRHPLGSGIGTQGFFAQAQGQADADVLESWLGVLLASTGVLPLVVVVVAGSFWARRAWRASGRLDALRVYPLAVLAVAALSESASALRGTPAMWLLLGEAIVAAGPQRSRSLSSPSEQHRLAEVIWVVRDGAFTGGAERVALDLARGLTDMGMGVQLLSAESRRSAELPAGVDRVRVGTPFEDLDLVRPLRLFPAEDAVSYAVRRRLERRSVARAVRAQVAATPHAVVVLNHNAVLRRVVAKADEPRVVVHLHASARQLEQELRAQGGLDLLRRLRARARRSEARRLMRLMSRCAEVVTTSPGEARALEALLGRPVAAIVNPLPWSVRVSGDPGPPSKGRLLYVGRLAEEKRPELALEVWQELRSRGHTVELQMLGEGPLRPVLEQRAAALGLSPSQVLPGAVAIGPATYQDAGVLLLPSDFEAFPMVLLEAASQGLPSVATSVSPGVAWIAERTQAVRLVPAGDVGAMADAIEAWWGESCAHAEWRWGRTYAGLCALDAPRVLHRWSRVIDRIGSAS